MDGYIQKKLLPVATRKHRESDLLSRHFCTHNQCKSSQQLHAKKDCGTLSVGVSTSTQEKLKYGYQVCEYLGLGKTMNDLGDAAVSNLNSHSNDGKTEADHLIYFLTMQKLAVTNLCPKYQGYFILKSRLSVSRPNEHSR